MFPVLIILLVLVCFFGPLAGIWSLNILFGLSIPFTIKTYFAALVLSCVVYGKTK